MIQEKLDKSVTVILISLVLILSSTLIVKSLQTPDTEIKRNFLDVEISLMSNTEFNRTLLINEHRTYVFQIDNLTLNLLDIDPFSCTLKFGVDVRHINNLTWSPDILIRNYRVTDWIEYLEITSINKYESQIVTIQPIKFYVEIRDVIFYTNAKYPLEINPYIQLTGYDSRGNFYESTKLYPPIAERINEP